MRFTSSTVLIAVFFCAFLILAYLNFFRPAIQQSTAQLELERQQIIKIHDNITNFKNKYGDLDEYMQKIEERYQLTNKSLPENLMQGEFITFLQKAAMENQIKIISLTPSTAKQLEIDSADLSTSNVGQQINTELIQGLNMLPINLKIECDYMELINFLKLLETSERLVQIKNFSIDSKDGGEKLICEICLLIFSLER